MGGFEQLQISCRDARFLSYPETRAAGSYRILVETPDFCHIQKLERLDLTGCIKLSQVHPSIGLLTELAFLSLRNCSSLVRVDLSNESMLSSLRVLQLSGCTKLENTPDFTGLSNLEYLDLEQCTSLRTVHESIGALAKLKFLNLRQCTNLLSIPNTVNSMTSLITLDLCGCSKLRNLPSGQTSFRNLPLFKLPGGALMGSSLMSSPHLGSLIFLDVGFCNLCELPDAIGELRCLERLNLEGNKFVSLPKNIMVPYSLAYLNLSHCHELQSLPLYLPSASSGGRYFKTVSGSRNHRSGLYIFDCPMLTDNDIIEYWAGTWLERLVKEPSHFRCGFDIVIPGSVIPHLFVKQFTGDSIARIVHADVKDDWIGFAFCVAFEVNYGPVKSGSPQRPHPFYLSFESEYAEESFDMPLHLDLNKIDGSRHLWLIYISRPHCHFVKTGAGIRFKARPGLKMQQWGLRSVFEQELESVWRLHWFKVRDVKPQNKWQESGERNRVDHLPYVSVSERSSRSEPKIQLPYNWLVTEEEENDKMEAEQKENNLSHMGL